jgi:sirohydrochlorin ferrochelatase
MSNATGILIISHGSPRAEANQGFQAMVARVAARLPGYEVEPAFFSITRPDIPDQVSVLASRGVQRILLMPYFLYSGQHVMVDIPVLLEQCRQRFPQLVLDLLPTLENDPVLETLLVDRLSQCTTHRACLPGEAAARKQPNCEEK